MCKRYRIFTVWLIAIIFIFVTLTGANNETTKDNAQYNLENNPETNWTHENQNVSKIKISISSKDNRHEDVLWIPPFRPYTPVEHNLTRTLQPVRIDVGESLCIFQKYTYFYSEALSRQMSPLDLLMNATITFREKDYYFYDPEDLCLSIDDQLNADIWKFDCNPAGYCDCGIYYGYVDTDIPPRIADGQVHYSQVYGLDRKLVVEDGECKSGLNGHCSLPGSIVKHPLKCSTEYDCVSDDSFASTLKNAVTNQIYGVCLPKRDEASLGFYENEDDEDKDAATDSRHSAATKKSLKHSVIIIITAHILLF